MWLITMKNRTTLGKKLEHFRLNYLPNLSPPNSLLQYIASHANSFWLNLIYFIFLSLLGYIALKVSTPRTPYKLNDLDLFFTSVSAATVSSMSTLEMEVFSDDQLIVITILMFLGGEIFTSIITLQFRRYNNNLFENSRVTDSTTTHNNQLVLHVQNCPTASDQIIQITRPYDSDKPKPTMFLASNNDHRCLIYNSIKLLGYVVLGYLIVIQVLGTSLVSTYISVTPSANNVLKSKGLVLETFSIFTVVSTFTNCGFIPTNEGMMVFKKNSGLLLILLPQIFLGNTLYPILLRFVIWVLERFTKRKEYKFILNNYQQLGYDHLISSKESWFLGGSLFGFWLLQFVMFCVMEWRSEIMEGMSLFEKFVSSLFQTANSRHAGESIVDLSLVSPAILVLFIVMMYLPPYTSYIPIGDQRQEAPEKNEKQKHKMQNLVLSQLSYLSIFVMVICITERKSMNEDPLNFTLLNLVFEVISAYGNVGFSIGYSCDKRLKLDNICQDKLSGFAGRWSKGGKLTLILVMLFGKLKNFNMNGGKAWKLS